MDKDSYLTIAEPSQGVFRDRGSKFMAFAYPVKDENEIRDILDDTRKKYHDAKHHCFAWRLSPSSRLYRVSDAGEPHNSAGRPILGQIQSFDLYDILVVVVRYFGGTLLGIPGLVNAYKTAAHEALAGASVREKVITSDFMINFGYENMNIVMKILKDMDLGQYDQRFEQDCQLKVRVPRSKTGEFQNHFILHPDIIIKHL